MIEPLGAELKMVPARLTEPLVVIPRDWVVELGAARLEDAFVVNLPISALPEGVVVSHVPPAVIDVGYGGPELSGFPFSSTA